MQLIYGYGLVALLFIAVDALWLSAMVPRLYRPALGDLIAPEPNLAAAAAFYLVYPVGLVAFAIQGALASGVAGQAFLNGALFGGLAYATYDLTNMATLRHWSLAVTIVDIGWGAFASGLAAFVATVILQRWA